MLKVADPGKDERFLSDWLQFRRNVIQSIRMLEEGAQLFHLD